MLKKFLNKFKELSLPNKSLVYLVWIFFLWNAIVTFFINVYIFKAHNSYPILLATTIFFGLMSGISFILWWYAISKYRKDIKFSYYISYIFFILSFISLFFFKNDLHWAFIFYFFYSSGYGLFRNWIHTQEINNITDKQRDFYTSSVAFGRNLLFNFVPFIISIIFVSLNFIWFDPYYIVLLAMPCFYFISLAFINDLAPYSPEPLKIKEIKKSLSFRWSKYSSLYYLLSWFKSLIEAIIFVLIWVIFLKNEVNIWFFQWVLGLFSTYVVAHLWLRRHEWNRFKYYAFFSFLMVINIFLLVLNFNLFFYIWYSLILLILAPQIRTSEHIYNLSLMDNLKDEKGDNYTSIITREIYMVSARVLGWILLFVLYKIFDWDLITMAKITLLTYMSIYSLNVFLIYSWEKKEKLSF